ncbi:MAG: hypothetical protein IT370_13705 [Deltaproteobacteria bacterium]|nr:hypothetical protein [Deltaproteobacteria bacterium]
MRAGWSVRAGVWLAMAAGLAASARADGVTGVVLRWREARAGAGAGAPAVEHQVKLEGDRVAVDGGAAKAVPGLGQEARRRVAVASTNTNPSTSTSTSTSTSGTALPCGAPLAGWLESGEIEVDLANPEAWRRWGGVAQLLLAAARGQGLHQEGRCQALRLTAPVSAKAAPARAVALPGLLDAYSQADDDGARLGVLAQLARLPDAEPFWAAQVLALAPTSPAARGLLVEHAAALVRDVADVDQARRLLTLLDAVAAEAAAAELPDLLWHRALLRSVLGDEVGAGELRRAFQLAQGRDDRAAAEDALGRKLAAATGLARAVDFNMSARLRALCDLALAYDARVADVGADSRLGALFALRATHYARRLEASLAPPPGTKAKASASKDVRLALARALLARHAPAVLARPLFAWPMRARLELCDLAAQLRRAAPSDASASAAGATPSLEVLAVDLQRLVRFGNLTDAEALARQARVARKGAARGEVDLVLGDALAAVELDERAALVYQRAAAAGAAGADARLQALAAPHGLDAGALGASDGKVLAAALARLASDPADAQSRLRPLVAVRDAAPAALALAAAAELLADGALGREPSAAQRRALAGRRALGDLLAARALARAAGDPDVLLTLAEIWTTTAARARDARSALALAREAAPDRARGYAIEARLAELGGDRVGAARAADAAAHLRPRDPTLRELRRRTRLAVPPDVAPSVAGGGSAGSLAAPNL